MKIIDKNGRLFGKISIIDVLVILVIALLVIALEVKNNQPQTSSTTTNDRFTFQLRVAGVRTYIADAVRVGDKVYDTERDSGGALGKITDIEVLPGTAIADLADAPSREALPMEDGVTLILTVEGEGILSDNRYLINRVYNLGVNAYRAFCTPYAQFSATVINIGIQE